MDTLILQSLGRHGHHSELARSQGKNLTVGRGYSNDVILDDPFIDEQQLAFRFQNKSWTLNIIESTNPVLINGRPAESGAVIATGDRLSIGRTQLQLFTSDHAVEKTRQLMGSTYASFAITKPLVASVLVLMACSIALFKEYQGMATKIDWNLLYSSAMILILILVLWAASWALAGRLLRHQPNFFAQLGFTALITFILEAIVPLPAFLGYALNSELTGEIALWLIMLGYLILLLFFNLSYATNLKKVGLTAVLTGTALALFSYLIVEVNEEDFSAKAEISSVLRPPLFRVVDDQSIAQYMDTYQKQFDRIDRLLSE